MGDMVCRICGNKSKNEEYNIEEMRFGTRDMFSYFQCGKCKCLQITDLPVDLSKYYPENYFSFSLSTKGKSNPIKRYLIKERDSFAVSNRGIIGRLVHKKLPNDILRPLSYIDGVTRKSRILDVGCGAGSILYALKEIGFESLLGVDLFIKEDIDHGGGLRICKQTIHDVRGKWDLIMLHHSLEHMPDQHATLKTISNLLEKNGTCMIRVPTVSSYAWEYYHENWVGVDAPRHLYLHSNQSMELLAKEAGLRVERTLYDSTSFQFWGSELYKRDVAINGSDEIIKGLPGSHFSESELAEFKERSAQLNEDNRGDQAAYYLKKA